MRLKRLTNLGGVVCAVLLLAVGLFLGSRAFFAGSRSEPGRNLRYDLSSFLPTDPALLRCREVGSFAVCVSNASALAVGEGDRIYVGGLDAVSILEPDGGLVARIGIGKPAACLGVDGSVLYVGSRAGVDKYDGRTGAHLGTLGAFGENAILTCVAVGEDEVLVSDAGAGLVFRFSKDGVLKGKLGEKARGLEPFIIPSPYFDAAFAPDGSAWVVDPGRHMLINFAADGRAVSSWKGAATMSIEGFCGCCNPSHIAIRADSSFVTSEKGLTRVKLYGPAGNFIGVVAGCEEFPDDSQGNDVAVDSKGRILVLDAKRNVVRVFAEK